jgi:putative transposase
MDNGPELIAKIMDDWSMGHGIEFIRIQPGKPTQNAYIERLNRSFREGALDAFNFETIDELRECAQDWMNDYNHHRPHRACKRLPPVVYAQKYLKQ